MSASVLTASRQITEINNHLYGSNRLAQYKPYINHIVGQAINHSTGHLDVVNKKTFTYDVNEQFPDDQLAAHFSAGATELNQLTASAKSYQLTINPLVVELIIKSSQSANHANSKASALRKLLEQWDASSYKGWSGNQGVANNSNLSTLASKAVDNIDKLVDAVNVGIASLKSLGLRDSDLAQVSLGYTHQLSTLFNSFSNANKTQQNKDVINKLVGGGCHEIPPICSGDGKYIELYARPLITLHHGAIPSVYSVEKGAHGLTESNLFAMETTAIEVQEKGAIVRIPIS